MTIEQRWGVGRKLGPDGRMYVLALTQHACRTARGQVQNLRPGQTRPHSAQVAGRDKLYTGQSTIDRGDLIILNEGEVGLRKDCLLSEAAWGRTWPDHNNTDRPVGVW